MLGLRRKRTNLQEKYDYPFQDDSFPGVQDRFQALVRDGKYSNILSIGCSDSRLVPRVISVHSGGPGELFIVRNVVHWGRRTTARPATTEWPPRSSSPCFDFENAIPQSLAFLRAAGIEKEIPLIATGGSRRFEDIAHV